MAFPWAAVAGIASSFLGGRAKAPGNPFLNDMKQALGRSRGIVEGLNLEDIDQKSLEAYERYVNRIGDRLVSQQNASDFAAGGTPLADSERGVARGVISKSVGDAIGDRAASLEASRNDRYLDAWNRIFSMGAQGYGPQSQQNALNSQAQQAQTSAIFNLANSFIGNRAAGGTGSQGYTPSTPLNTGGWAGYTGSDATTRNLKNEGIFL